MALEATSIECLPEMFAYIIYLQIKRQCCDIVMFSVKLGYD